MILLTFVYKKKKKKKKKQPFGQENVRGYNSFAVQRILAQLILNEVKKS